MGGRSWLARMLFSAMTGKAKAPPGRGFRAVAVMPAAGRLPHVPMLPASGRHYRFAALFLQAVADLAQQHHFFGRRRRAASFFRDSRLIALTTMKIAKATITNWMTVLMKSP